MSAAQWDRIPEELRKVGAWCIAGADKAPYTTGLQRASVIDPCTWVDYYSASLVAAQHSLGIGYVLHEGCGLVCIDLDVKDDTPPERFDLYKKIIDTFDSYTERSRSGRGFHVWLRGEIGPGCRRDGVELYSQERFMVCTGDVFLDRPIREGGDLLDLLVEEMRVGQVTKFQLIELAAGESDDVVMDRAWNAVNGDKFQELWKGDWQVLGYPSQSEADLSLLSMLCFYSNSNEQIRRLFRMSGLGKRPKATKNDKYIDRTLSLIRGRQDTEQRQIEAQKPLLEKLTLPKAPHPLLPVTTKSTLEWPPGLVGDLAKWFYSIAPRPVKEIAIVSALGVAAGVFGRAYNISGSGLNLYIVLVARSAIGKEAMHTSISKLIHHMLSTGAPAFSEFIDFADYASGPALIKSIQARSSFLNVAGEWGRKLRKMGDDHTDGPMSSLRTAMTNLYQKSGAGTIVGGIGYSDKEKNVSAVNGVAYSMIGETTPDNFYESMTNTMMQDGFMSRFITVEYTGLRPELNKELDKPMPEDLYNGILNATEEVLRCPPGGYRDVPADTEAAGLLADFDEESGREINSTNDETWRQMWNRAHLKTLKVAALLAVADRPTAPVIRREHAEWALALIRRDIKVMGRRISEGDIGTGDIARERKLLATLAEYVESHIPSGYKVPEEMRKAGVVPRKYLQIRLQKINCFVQNKTGQTDALNKTLKSLADSGYVVELTPDKVPVAWGYHGKCYRIITIPDIH